MGKIESAISKAALLGWLSGCGTTGLEVENRVDGAPFNAFVCPINRCTHYLEIFHLEIVSILGNRVVRFKDVSKKRSKGNGNLIFVVDEARFVKFIRIRKMLRGELERQK